MEASKYQQDIYNWVTNGRGNCIIQATSGSGKTLVLVEASKLLKTDSILFCAFNKHIVEELSARLPKSVTVKTIHSIGFSTLCRSGKKFKTTDYKYQKICQKFAQDIFNEYPELNLNLYNLKVQLQDLVKFSRLTLIESKDKHSMLKIISHHNIELEYPEIVLPKVSAILNEGEMIARYTGEIDFTDMLWLPHQWHLQPLQYDWVLCDEAQDLSNAQQALVMAASNKGGRMLFCGDINQCQPAGTMVALPNGKQKPIEELKVGDEVVSYDRRGAGFVGLRNQGCKKVLAVASRPYQGQMITIKAADRATECTANHRWITRWTDRSTNKFVTYLMRQGNRFRVGWCQLFTTTGCFHLSVRAQGEKADAAWILGVHTDRTKASIQESLTATMFGLPTIPFEPVDGATHLTKIAIDEFFTTLNELDPMQEQKAKDCLAWFGRDIVHPLYSKVERQRQGRTTIFETTASNLISGFMSIPYFEGDRVVRWSPVEIKSAIKECDVYSLKIETHETYVANGLATHNSIYGFAGADSNSMENLTTLSNSKTLPLSICYRCPTSHIKLAQEIVPEIECAPGAKEGVVSFIGRDDLPDIVKEGDLIICRLTAPLVKLCIQLIGKRIPAKVKGRDIATQLTKIVRDIEKLPDFRFDKFLFFLRIHCANQLARLNRVEDNEALIDSFLDKLEGIKACYAEFDCSNITDFCNEIESLFSDTRSSVLLSVVHRVKGLENKRVIILKPEKLPLHWKNQKDWQLKQEYCLKFVALTRATEELIFVQSPKRRSSQSSVFSNLEDVGQRIVVKFDDDDDDDNDGEWHSGHPSNYGFK